MACAADVPCPLTPDRVDSRVLYDPDASQPAYHAGLRQAANADDQTISGTGCANPGVPGNHLAVKTVRPA